MTQEQELEKFRNMAVTLIIQKAILYVEFTEKWLDDFLTYEEAKLVYDHITDKHREFFQPKEGIVQEILALIGDETLLPPVEQVDESV